MLYVDFLNKCPNTDYNNSATDALHYVTTTGTIDRTIVSMGSVFSYFVFIGCFMAAKRKDSALVSPSQSLMKDVDKREILLLFGVFVFISLLLSSSVGLFYRFLQLPANTLCKRVTLTGVAAQFLLYLMSLNTCHIFAISSLTLGKLFLLSF